MSIELFATQDCPKCHTLSEILDEMGISYTKRVIDLDPLAETDALMLNIYSAPALRKGNDVMREKEIFSNGQVSRDKVKDFVKEFNDQDSQFEEPRLSEKIKTKPDKRWATLDGLFA